MVQSTRASSLLLAFAMIAVPPSVVRAEQPSSIPLPAGVKAVWDIGKAFREKTSTRECLCLNGLWRWQPAADAAGPIPTGEWGYFKVPGFWPGTSSYIQEDCQELYVHPAWKRTDVRALGAAWYEREFRVPIDWTGRRIALAVECLNSFAVVHVDGKKVGEIRFPSGEADLTAACRPGGKHVLSLLVLAMPLKGVMLSYSDTNTARTVKGTVERRGLCGDVYLTSEPQGARIGDIHVTPSVRKKELSINAALEGLNEQGSYALRIEVRDKDRVVRAFASAPFKASDLRAGRIAVTEKWMSDKLWDVHTPENQLTALVTLVDSAGRALDVAHPITFGFREFWIDGKDFFLNGSRIFLSAVPLDNAQIGARTASYDGTRETMKRLRKFGINFIYTHNYGCQPGAHLSFSEVLRAADDAGMLVGFSQPHFGHYDWKAEDADKNNGYARHAEFYVRMAQNHPAVVAYSMSHNATGHDEDMNPDFIDGIQDPRGKFSQRQADLAVRAAGIVKRLDPSRVVYHHSSGNLGSMHTCNFYLNWVPIQEMSDWFEHWATKGVKPVFLVEYGVPFSWDWSMYRGWYQGERSFGSAKVPWEFCLAEWNAQFFGDRAYRISELEKRNLRWEAGQFRAGKLWNRWDYPVALGSSEFDERAEVFARYITDNWRAFRTWGLSANSPWEHHAFWRLSPTANRGRQDFKTDWETLQKPGFSADYTHRRNWQFVTDLDAEDWIPSAAAKALMRNNMPLLAYLAGPQEKFTSKSCNYFPGETVEKQLIVLNNSRETVSGEFEWSLGLPQPVSGTTKLSIRTGAQERIPLHFDLPATLPAGVYALRATARFTSGEVQSDALSINVVARRPGKPTSARIALLDPKGDTAKLLADARIPFRAVDANADLSGYDLLIVGREALTPDGPGPDVRHVRDGLRVVVFEQTAAVLEQRFGFRVTEYGLREVFPRVPDHPVLSGLENGLHDWRGEATLLPPRLTYTQRPQHGPTVKWCGIDVSRPWRCGNRGNVASVLIEKPARGNFLPILDGGYALQYSPLMEFREGKGMVLFCQLDVTARTESDPAAQVLARQLIHYVSAWKPSPRRTVLYAGDSAGKRHLEAVGLAPGAFDKRQLTAATLLIVGPGGGRELALHADGVATWLKAGGNMLAIGLDDKEANGFVPQKIATKRQEHISTYFPACEVRSLFAGISPADVHNRDPRDLPLVSAGATVLGNGVLAKADDNNVLYCQLAPWQFDPTQQTNQKRTFRRVSYLVTRLAANLGAASSTPCLPRFHSPATSAERRWLDSFYLDVPGEWDDPYRFFRW
jgi:beta-galactosidase